MDGLLIFQPRSIICRIQCSEPLHQYSVMKFLKLDRVIEPLQLLILLLRSQKVPDNFELFAVFLILSWGYHFSYLVFVGHIKHLSIHAPRCKLLVRMVVPEVLVYFSFVLSFDLAAEMAQVVHPVQT